MPVAKRAGLRVLLLDDDEEMLQTFRRVLERAGHRVSTGTCVGDARQLVDAQDFDVVVSDYWMTDGTGAEVARALGTRPTRVVFLTGDCAISSDGRIPVLHKPVPASELLRAVCGAASPGT